jgi:hypothetical protein
LTLDFDMYTSQSLRLWTFPLETVKFSLFLKLDESSVYHQSIFLPKSLGNPYMLLEQIFSKFHKQFNADSSF